MNRGNGEENTQILQMLRNTDPFFPPLMLPSKNIRKKENII